MSRKTFHFQQPHSLRLTGAARRLRSSLVPPPSPRFASPSATVVTTITRVRLLPSSYQIHRRGWEPRIQLLLVKSLQLTPPIYSSCSGPVFADNGALGSVIEMLFHLRAGKLSRCLISVSVYRWFCGVISRILILMTGDCWFYQARSTWHNLVDSVAEKLENGRREEQLIGIRQRAPSDADVRVRHVMLHCYLRRPG